jgi:peptidoglycan/xylan/chitin deacetylase (PgdA/CDA1 family)
MRLLKRAAHAIVSALGSPLAVGAERVLRFSGRRVGLAVVYHKVGDPPGDPRRELVPAVGTRLFAAQLRHLNDRYRLVPASELFEATTRRRRGQRFPVAVTFDDDLRSHSEVALPILRRLALPAAFFVSGTSLDGPFRFWWERLQVGIDRGIELPEAIGGDAAGSGLGRQNIHELGRRIEALTPAERDVVASQLAAAVGPDPPDAGLREADLRALAAGGCEIGFHTLRHDPLPTLDDESLAQAMRRGRSRLEEVLGQEITTIAYPHGRADLRVATAARAAGYAFGFTGSIEAVRPTSDPLLLGRVDASYRSVGHLALQLVRALLRTPPKRREPPELG